MVSFVETKLLEEQKGKRICQKGLYSVLIINETVPGEGQW